MTTLVCRCIGKIIRLNFVLRINDAGVFFSRMLEPTPHPEKGEPGKFLKGINSLNCWAVCDAEGWWSKSEISEAGHVILRRNHFIG